MTMRTAPNPTPTATPMATAMRRPQGLIVPPETAPAFSATARSDGSAMVVPKPMAAAKA